jgi:hypothetical protein
MPHWSNQLPDTPTKYAYELKRTPPDSPLTAIVLSADLLGCYTHYWAGHTVPCEYCPPDPTTDQPETPCDACTNGSPARWHAYLACWNPKTHSVFLFECTLQAAKAFETYRADYGTLRGCFFSASRPRRRRNAKIEILTRPADLSKLKLPDAPDLLRAMSVIWQLPPTAHDTTERRHGTPLATPRAQVLAQLHGPTRKSNGEQTQ